MLGMKPKEIVCAIIGAPCPETNDPQSALAKQAGRYCPNWVDAIPETHSDGSGRFTQEIYKGCLIPKLVPYLVSIASYANHAGASADKAATQAQEASSAANLTTLALKHVGVAIETQGATQGLFPEVNSNLDQRSQIKGENCG